MSIITSNYCFFIIDLFIYNRIDESSGFTLRDIRYNVTQLLSLHNYLLRLLSHVTEHMYVLCTALYIRVLFLFTKI